MSVHKLKVGKAHEITATGVREIAPEELSLFQSSDCEMKVVDVREGLNGPEIVIEASSNQGGD